MKNNNFIIFSFIGLLGVMSLTGCGGGSSSGDSSDNSEATFTVQLNNASLAERPAESRLLAIALPVVATSLTAKLGGVDLLKECTGGNPPGDCSDEGTTPDPDIWVNEGCDNDIAQCTIENTEFFELIDPTAANEILNSQGRISDVATYTHVRIYFLNNDGAGTIECNNGSVAIKPPFPITVALDEPFDVAEGDNVTVTLNYDPSGVDCSNEITIQDMFSAMTATVTKN